MLAWALLAGDLPLDAQVGSKTTTNSNTAEKRVVPDSDKEGRGDIYSL